MPNPQHAYPLEHNFTYHPPRREDVPLFSVVRGHGYNLADTILRACPESRERSLALTKVEEAVMWANAAIARHGGHSPDAALAGASQPEEATAEAAQGGGAA